MYSIFLDQKNGAGKTADNHADDKQNCEYLNDDLFSFFCHFGLNCFSIAQLFCLMLQNDFEVLAFTGADYHAITDFYHCERISWLLAGWQQLYSPLFN